MKAKELMKKGTHNCICVDVRTPMEFEKEHIVGAKPLPLNEFTTESFKEICGEGCDKDIVIICHSDKRAWRALKILEDQDTSRVKVLDGGMLAWRADGGDIIEGVSSVISLDRQVRIAAGLFILLGVILGFTVHSYVFIFSGAVGAGLIFAGITDTCGLACLLARMPWNQMKTVQSIRSETSHDKLGDEGKEEVNGSSCDSGG